MIIDQSQAITKLNANLAASINYGEQWFIAFASLNIKPLLISLKLRLTFQLPILNGTHILPEDFICFQLYFDMEASYCDDHF